MVYSLSKVALEGDVLGEDMREECLPLQLGLLEREARAEVCAVLVKRDLTRLTVQVLGMRAM